MKKGKNNTDLSKLNRFQLKKQKKKPHEEENKEIDAVVEQQSSDEEEENVQSSSLNNKRKAALKKQKAAWEDEDDKEIMIDISSVARLKKLKKSKEETVISGQEYQERLQSFYNEKLNHFDFFKWGSASENAMGEPDQNMEDPLDSKSYLKDLISGTTSLFETDQVGGLLAKKKSRIGTSLPEGIIKMERSGVCSKVNQHEAVVQCIDFHNNNEIFLSAGYDKYLKIFSTRQSSKDGFKKELKLLKNVFLEGLPIMHSEFVEKRNEVLSCGLKRHLLSYDLEHDKFDKICSNMFTSRFQKRIDKFSVSPLQDYIALFNEQGYVTVLSGTTKQFLFEFKMNEACNSVCFDAESKYLYSTGLGGKIYQWDMNKRSIYSCFNDVGSTNTTCMALSDNGNYLASGNSSGTVNIYDLTADSLTSRKPLKEIQNLTTNITDIKWNKEGEVLGIFSKWKRNSIRLAHFPSMTVFSNWPNLKTNLKFVTALGLSDDCRHMALGNDEGRVFMYDFPYY